ncbi:MAG: bifunctional folylpolyglutamate synthase/dihydrofolate synthase [Candidatus Methylomirabilales bacterium]
MDYRDAIAYLTDLARFGMRLGLERIEAAMEALGYPERSFRSIHVAGTNGKGSTAAFIASVLRAAGLRVGLYTSPHLLDLRERFLVDGRPIAEPDLAALVTELRSAIERVPATSPGAGADVPGHAPAAPSKSLTFFEATTALAFLHFARSGVEVAVIEVGLGGRYDATNVIRPEVAVLTNIGLDHRKHLGETLQEIAAEKAGIVKTGVPVVSAVSPGPALDVLRHACWERGASLTQVTEAYRSERMPVTGWAERFRVGGPAGDYPALTIPLRGRHQVQNALTAIATVEALTARGVHVDPTAIPRGLAETRWPGRLHLIPGAPRILIDGAHNPAAMAELVRFLWEECPNGQVWTIFGVLQDKDWRAMLALVGPRSSALILTRPDGERAAHPGALVEAARAACPRVEVVPRMGEALERARALAAPEDTILITGSFYTVAPAFRALGVRELFP